MMPISPRQPDRAGILHAAQKLKTLLPQTPLMPLDVHGTTIWCKAENLQPVGAFKIRGAWHCLTELSSAAQIRGVVGVSSGNHAQGVAWAARKLGISATLVMPNDAPRVKLDATKALGANIVLYDRPGGESRDEVAAQIIAKTGATLVHAFADPFVIEGQGSIGIEIAEQMKDLAGSEPDKLVCPCGGGGLTSGLSLACPDTEIVPVEPDGWDTVGRSLAAGQIVPIGKDPPHTPCDALQTPITFPLNFGILQHRVPAAVTVSTADIRNAQRMAFSKLRLVLEPGGAAALAAVLSGKVEITTRMAVVLTGGNTDPAAFAQVLLGND